MSNQHPTTRKAAILVASLDRQTADEFLQRLPESVAASIRDEILSLSSSELAGEAEVIHEFLAESPSSLVEASDESVRFDFTSTENDRPALAESTSFDPVDPGVSLHQASAPAIARQLRTERHQTIAMAVSKLPPDKAAQVLAQLMPSQQTLVIDRLIELRATAAAAVDDVCDELESALNRKLPPANDKSFCRDVLFRLINETEGSARENLLQKAEKLDVASATFDSSKPGDDVSGVAGVVEASDGTNPDSKPADFYSAAIVFDDLVHLDNNVLAAVLQRCAANDLLIALRGADRKFLQRLQSCLPPSEADELEQRVRQLGPVRLADVQASQQRLAAAAAEIASVPLAVDG